MQTIGKVVPYAIGGLLGGTLLKGLFKSPKPTPVPGPLQRNDARLDQEKQDELARRRGGAADMVTGAYGGEPAAGTVGKTTLGS